LWTYSNALDKPHEAHCKRKKNGAIDAKEEDRDKDDNPQDDILPETQAKTLQKKTQ
jgi:hypothetical protein